MQESISEDALKAFNLKDEKSFLSKEEEQSTFAHINLENSSKIIQDLTKALMNETEQLLLTLKSTSTKLVRESRQDESQSDLNDQTQSDLNDQIQSDLNDQIQSDLNAQSQSDLNAQNQSDLNN
jgi:replicative superfamily II helicase